jgi:hypothetical protein
VLSTLADSRLALTSAAGSRPCRSQARSISVGVLREAAPLPPVTTKPKSPSTPLTASLIAPQVVVVTPLECQSKPKTQPNAWNQNGSDSRASTSLGP